MATIAQAKRLADDMLYRQDLDHRIDNMAREVLANGSWVDGKGHSGRPDPEELADPNLWEMTNLRLDRDKQRKLARMIHERRGYERYFAQRVPTLNGGYAVPGSRIAWIIGPGTRSVIHTGEVVDILPNNTVRVIESDEKIMSPENDMYGYRSYRTIRTPQTTVIRCTHALISL